MAKVTKSDDEWRRELEPEVYEITRKAGTERAFAGKYWDTKTPGTYTCRCCGAELFDSATKFDSGTGWPSFYEPVCDTAVATRDDDTMMMRRTEVLCAECEAHLGHLFPDGPQPTGMRYCMNSASLQLVERDGPQGD